MANELNFEQRHGGAPLPTQLRPNEVSRELQAKLWAGLHASMIEEEGESFYGPRDMGEAWRTLLLRWHVQVEHRAADEFTGDLASGMARVKTLIYRNDFAKLYTFLEFVARTSGMSEERDFIAFALEDARSAWRLMGKMIVPISSEQEGAAVAAALTEVDNSGRRLGR